MALSYGRADSVCDDFRDYYALLDVAWDADPDDLERAYRKLVASSHPDRFSCDGVARRTAETRLKELSAAMRVLRDATQRSHYDERFRREKPLTVRLVRGSSRGM
jgi:curved DNA-binding protein CbpA